MPNEYSRFGQADFREHMNSYHIWTIGCQMNTADSDRLAGALEQMGLEAASSAKDADVVVLNSCVVRQAAEDKVVGNLGLMKSLRQHKPDSILALMGCMVGPKVDDLKRRFPYVDTFMQPQQFGPLLDMVGDRLGVQWEGCVGPLLPVQPSVRSYVPIIHGCDLMCTFCIIPYRRGRQVSRPIHEVAEEVRALVRRGVKEVTLLGQTVDAYGYDLPEKPNLADLLESLNSIDGLQRIRFLTSHPSFMSQQIIDAVAGLDKVCEYINLPVQAGDDDVLAGMRRRYTEAEYRELVAQIRSAVPDVSISTDVIVGFPGETQEQYEHTIRLIEDLEFSKVHSAAYSTRPGTIAHRTMTDDVFAEDKKYRLKNLDLIQENILAKANAEILGKTVEVLVDGRHKGKWQGRTRSDKLVFIEDEGDLLGQIMDVRITRTSPWSLQGAPA